MTKLFKCGFCKDEKEYVRENYRKHLKTHTRNELMNNSKGKKQNWVIEREWN